MDKTIEPVRKQTAELRHELYLSDVSAGPANPDKDHDGFYRSRFNLTAPVHPLISSESDLVILGAQCGASFRVDDRYPAERWCIIQYFRGFDDPAAPSFKSLPIGRRSRIMRTIALRGKADGIYTLEDGYEEIRSQRGNEQYRLSAHTSAEWGNATRDSKSLGSFDYMEVTFPEKTAPQAAFSRDLHFICSYEALTARNDFVRLMAEAGIEKKEVIAANNQKESVFTHKGVSVSRLEAFLRIQSKAFFRDLIRAKPHLAGRIKKDQNEYESHDEIPLYIIPSKYWAYKGFSDDMDSLTIFDLRSKTLRSTGARYR